MSMIMTNYENSSYDDFMNHIQKSFPSIRDELKMKVFEMMSEYSPYNHQLAKMIFNVKGDYETQKYMYNKIGKKIENFESMQSIYYMLCWFSGFKEREQTMRVLEHSWNNINGWLA